MPRSVGARRFGVAISRPVWQVKEMRWRFGLVGLSLVLVACGGEATHGAPAAGGQDSAAAAGSAAGGTSSFAGRTSTGDGDAGAEAAGGFPEFTSSFDTTQPQTGIGLWMGMGETLPVEKPPLAHDGTALHLVGDSGTGLDVFYHTPLPVESIAREVKFSAYSEEGDAITLGIAGPEATYFADQASGVAWPQQAFQLGARWKSYRISLDELSPAPPHEEMFGAVHIVVQPGTHYDFWIDDFALVSRTR